MRIWIGLLVAAAIGFPGCGSAGTSVAAMDQVGDRAGANANTAGEPRLRHTQLDIEDASDGSCSGVSMANGNGRRTMIDSCHGWIVASCNHLLFFHTRGVRADEGLILLPRRSGSDDPDQLSATALIASAVTERLGSGNEYLHLRFDQPQCTQSGFTLPFNGSFIARGASGPARAMRGELVVNADGSRSVRIGSP
ncbi:MAG TPA: hypothetical protein VJS15_00545 [Allosphingosinicella sp.]|nr:hypothetical protein [Allosphingosinicella sp.]